MSDWGNVKILNRILQGFSKPEIFKTLCQEYFAVVINTNTKLVWEELNALSVKKMMAIFFWKIFRKGKGTTLN